MEEAFVGPRPNGYVINHKDGNRSNNYLKNLEYITKSENKMHACYTLGKAIKVKPEDALDIIKLRKSGWTLIRIAKKYNISISTVSAIYLGKQMSHITGINKS